MSAKFCWFSTNKLIHRLRRSFSSSLTRLADFGRSTTYPMTCFYRFLAVRVDSLSTHLCYFLSLSFVGYCFLKSLKTRPGVDHVVPRSIDLFFTSVSASTASSMSTVEMEVFSDSQLHFITFLMFVGDEVFVSMIALMLKASRMWEESSSWTSTEEDGVTSSILTSDGGGDPILTPPHLELNTISVLEHHSIGSGDEEVVRNEFVSITQVVERGSCINFNHFLMEVPSSSSSVEDDHEARFLEYKSVRFLSHVIFCYLMVIHVVGISLLSLYLALSPSARDVLREKGLRSFTCSVFITVSTFASCGFIPANENMTVFRKNTGMLLILIPQVLLGNTLFPPCLRLCVWSAGKLFRSKSDCSEYLLRYAREVGFYHLLPGRESAYLAATVAGFVAVQLALFCATDWWSEGLSGMSPVEKLVGALFLTLNSRHAGETVVDLATVSTASLVVFVVMMYLPPYTSFLPTKAEGEEEDAEDQRVNANMVGDTCNDKSTGEVIRTTRRRGRRHSVHKQKNYSNKFLENVIISQLSFLAVFILLICITERQSMKEDPLNFSIFNVILEIISAYGNVGFSMGYSCRRQINPSGNCQDKFYGFSGKWSDEGKIVLILVMLFGRVKKFNMDGGKAWKLL